MKHIIMLEDASENMEQSLPPDALSDHEAAFAELVPHWASTPKARNNGAKMRQQNRVLMLENYFEGEDDESDL